VIQYPLKPEAITEIKPVLDQLLEKGLMRLCRSSCNTPTLPVKKQVTGEYRFVED
jgi:hypothetical protein